MHILLYIINKNLESKQPKILNTQVLQGKVGWEFCTEERCNMVSLSQENWILIQKKLKSWMSVRLQRNDCSVEIYPNYIKSLILGYIVVSRTIADKSFQSK